jgi:hypothetical protein
VATNVGKNDAKPKPSTWAPSTSCDCQQEYTFRPIAGPTDMTQVFGSIMASFAPCQTDTSP